MVLTVRSASELNFITFIFQPSVDNIILSHVEEIHVQGRNFSIENGISRPVL